MTVPHSQEKSETEKAEDTAEEVQTQSKPKWTPPKHAIGYGNTVFSIQSVIAT